jgi:hypothetical protein
MSDKQRRRITLATALESATSGLLAAAFLPIGAASADVTILEPDTSTFIPTEVTGNPPFTPEVVVGTEDWSGLDLTTNTVVSPDLYSGVDTSTVFGSFTNDDFATHMLVPFGTGEVTAYIDLTNFGGGWENEWIDLLAGPFTHGMADLLITPFGDFQLFGPAGLF